MQGSIVLEQIEPCKFLSEGSILLSDFDLPEEINEEIGAEGNLKLSMQGCYGFEIPLILDQFNVSTYHFREFDQPSVQTDQQSLAVPLL